MPENLIDASFRVICGSKSEEDRQIVRAKIIQVPAPGQTVSLNGHPFIVHEVSWAIYDDAEVIGCCQFAYVRVSPLRADAPYPPEWKKYFPDKKVFPNKSGQGTQNA